VQRAVLPGIILGRGGACKWGDAPGIGRMLADWTMQRADDDFGLCTLHIALGTQGGRT
jgi:hypothetical protein